MKITRAHKCCSTTDSRLVTAAMGKEAREKVDQCEVVRLVSAKRNEIVRGPVLEHHNEAGQEVSRRIWRRALNQA